MNNRPDPPIAGGRWIGLGFGLLALLIFGLPVLSQFL